MRWYTLHCKPRKEQIVYEQLLTRAIEAFFPCVPSGKDGRRKSKMEAYFPGYIFVHADFEQTGTAAVQWLPGVLNVVTFGGIPADVPDSLIHAIWSKVERIKNTGEDTMELMKPGDMINISDGPFAGHQAIFDSRLSGGERARVLITLLNRQKIQIQLPISQLYVK